MPHCVIEYSSNLSAILNLKEMMTIVQDVMVKSDLFDSDSIKIRAIKYDDYLISSRYLYFIHIKISILEGRVISEKELLARMVQECFAEKIISLPIVLTTEVQDMNKVVYQKLSLNAR